MELLEWGGTLKIVVASDSFKGSASTFEISDYIEKGIRRVQPDAIVLKIPLADGGEGTVDAIVTATNGNYVTKEVTGPLGQKVKAKFGIINEKVAIIEMAEASGLTLIKDEERNPFKTTTFGTGELIKAALDYGVDEVVIGIGGSATNDGGAGMAQALGVSLKDRNGNEIGYGAESLEKLSMIDITKIDPRLQSTKITVLSDVTNPLCGENGASYIYGPQKGATQDDLETLDNLLRKFGNKLEREFQINLVNRQGSGAAGGLGAGLMAFCDAKIYSGIERILSYIKLEDHIKDADLVITGEGRMDNQSVNGKAPLGVAKIAKMYHLPVVAIVGSEGNQLENVYNNGIDLVLDIVNKPMTLQDAMDNVRELTANAGEKAIRAFRLGFRVNHMKEEIL
ncbi:glycerate kinase [Niallia sp. CLA-SR-H024]|uniref:Glycerate kinase n=1 Tax=Niallia hominis TaxID=3133173 RepID=A0ABV1F0W6_9BACI|nr:glycerate kinase [Bacillus sp. T2.9-1]CAI9392973.1 Glycerate 2-kinase [Bacillus sp. T2.9-1]